MKTYNVCGISVLNPVDIEEEYLNFTVDYAIEKKYNHVQFIGPIHNNVKGNIDGMTFYNKYSQFNDEKDADYVNLNLRLINQALEKTAQAGIKSYMWHHELELPVNFSKAFPQVLNSDNDIEVSHPLVKDFLENKIKDFFNAYPKMDGIILTLHETRVPLLKLKNQKLDKVERVKYVTKILYDTCRALNKELICRPFASIEEDYAMMTKAYEEISNEMVIMDKWTQFDWSLTLPHNKFFAKIKNNPILVETDIFGEYFGKGRFPLMLKDHIQKKVEYCDSFNPVGYCSRIDRNGRHPFGDVNQVNLDIMHACTMKEDVENAIDNFFENKYPLCAKKVREIMEPTEEILTKIIYLKGYYFSELSLFPQLNHSKNHFYFEMMREDYALCSGEWFIPIGWQRGDIKGVIEEKEQAVSLADKVYQKLITLKDKMDKEEFDKLHVKFLNLKLCANIWRTLIDVFYNYAKFFEVGGGNFQIELYSALDKLEYFNEQGYTLLGKDFYCLNGDTNYNYIETFVKDVKESFTAEKQAFEVLSKQNLLDFVICGGASEGHKLKKEVNFSDTLVKDGRLARIPGSNRKGWSTVNAHGWFAYEIKVTPNKTNRIEVVAGSLTDTLDLKITIGDKQMVINKQINKEQVINFEYTAKEENAVYIRFDRLTANTPCIFEIKVY